ncbi:MAG: deoxyribodipyrimidine photo-lyase [Xanthomonadales bacterium]|nr:deoxyribodipyrimidine photo-lyase [Xanthomonadales bacterium]
MSTRPTILWFRNDLRLSDHPALIAASRRGQVLPVFILDDEAAGRWRAGGARRWWLHGSLHALAERIAEGGGQLLLKRGDTLDILSDLARESGADAVHFTRAYEPWARQLEERVHQRFGESMEVRRYPGALLSEPDRVSTRTGDPYRVFTPFWKALQEQVGQPVPEAAPEPDWVSAGPGDDLASWDLLPTRPDWAGGLRENWIPGESGAARRLARFVEAAALDYQTHRDRPDLAGTSRLSPYLQHGEVSPRQVWHRLSLAVTEGALPGPAANAYLRELGWREFSYHLLFHFPDLPLANFRPQFDHFPWRSNEAHLDAWQRGQTGYPLVDAGMRELWHTGWMHNRVRMIVGSFLVKHLLIDWRRGEEWFWDTLVDADLASNSASWQWVAGSGADAAPYFRIFNPIIQGEKFDPDGAYVRRWVPEIAGLPNRFLNKPWEAPAAVLREAGIQLGDSYPSPLVVHAEARQEALAAYNVIKGAARG